MCQFRYSRCYTKWRTCVFDNYRIQYINSYVEKQKKVFSSENLYETIWDEQYFYTANNTIMVHIRNLRKKLEKDQKNPQYIKTAWGKGYYID